MKTNSIINNRTKLEKQTHSVPDGMALSMNPASAKKPFILKDLPDYFKKGYSSLKVGMCQVYTEPWAVDANIERTLQAIDIASEQGAEIAVTPECVIQGYPVNETKRESKSFLKKIFAVAESPDGSHMKLFKKKAFDKKIYILAGFIEKGDDEIVYNSAALISPEGKYIYIYRKVHCRHFENINYWGCFTPGSSFHSADLKFGRKRYKTGTIICFDREIPESLRCLRALGTELVLCPLATDTNDMTGFKNEADNEIITRAASASNELFIVVVNHSGRFNGGSFITGPKGELFCQMTANPGVLTYDVPVGVIATQFHNNPLGWMGWGYRRPGIYKNYI